MNSFDIDVTKEQELIVPHIYTVKKIRDMISGCYSRMSESRKCIELSYRNYYPDMELEDFLDSLDDERVQELVDMQVDSESEKERLLSEIDIYRKNRCVLRELKGVLLIMEYNRLSEEERRKKNTEFLDEEGMTFLQFIEKTMPSKPYYFRGLRVVLPTNLTDPITLDSVGYENFRMMGGRVSLGNTGLGFSVPTVLTSHFVDHTETHVDDFSGNGHGPFGAVEYSTADDSYDLDDSRKESQR